jgi:hypothetical protein
VPTEGDDAGRERTGEEPSNQPEGDDAGRERTGEEPSNQPGGDPKRAKIGAWPLIC